MSRLLILLRHAQTAGKQAGQQDYDRVLTPLGEVQCRETRQLLVRNSFTPDSVLSSRAMRAESTARRIIEGMSIPEARQRYLDTLYESDGDTWMGQIRGLPSESGTVLCVGHNPVMSWLAGHLARRPIDLAPAGFVVLQSAALSWKEFSDDIREIYAMTHPDEGPR